MKHSEINHNENSFGIHLNNKGYSITNNSMPISSCNSNAVIITSVISTPMHHNTPTVLSTALNTQRPNIALLAKPISSVPVSSVGSNILGHFTYLSSNTNAIKLVNLSKCQQLQSLNKDNSSIGVNSAINVQFVTPILANTPSTESSTITKADNSGVYNAVSVPKTISSSNQSTTTTNNPITCTRYFVHSSQASLMSHSTVTIIPQHTEGAAMPLLNGQLIKNVRYTLPVVKALPQPIRPILASSLTPKQPLSRLTSCRPSSAYTISVSDHKRQPTPIKPVNYTLTPTTGTTTTTTTQGNSNIRLALTTSGITNGNGAKVSCVIPGASVAKIQLISPKSRKRSGSPATVTSYGQDGNIRGFLIPAKNSENLGNDMCTAGARKRARKQHLKSDTNNRVHKLSPHPPPPPSLSSQCVPSNPLTATITKLTVPPLQLQQHQQPQTVINIAPTKKEEDVEVDDCSRDNVLDADEIERRRRYSLFPHKYDWNPRRRHFDKESDVRMRRSKCGRYRQHRLHKEHTSDDTVLSVEESRTRLYKIISQLSLQRECDQDNLERLTELMDRLHQNDDGEVEYGDEPVFATLCIANRYRDHGDAEMGQISEERETAVSMGILEDIIDLHCADTVAITPLSPHRCPSDQCLLYSVQVPPPPSRQPHTAKINDLVQGLIVKERRIIDLGSEIHTQCLRLLHSADPVDNKAINGRRW